MNLRVFIKYKKPTDLTSRLTASLNLRNLIDKIKTKKQIQLKKIGDISCEFLLDNASDTEKAISADELKEFIEQFISASDYEIVISEESEAETEMQKPAEKPTEEKKEEKEQEEKRFENGENVSLGKEPSSKQDDEETLNKIISEIRSLIGFEQFKEKAEELVKVAPNLRKLKNYINNTKFLFSIDDGNGASTAASLLAKLLNALGLIKKSQVCELAPIPYVDNPRDMEDLKAKVHTVIHNNAYNTGIFVMDISKCYTHLSKVAYREFISDMCSDNIVIFRIPYLEETARVSVEEVLSDQFLLHTIPFVPLSMDELYAYAQKEIKEFGYEFDKDVREVFDVIVAREKSDGKFYGFCTVDKIVRLMIYEKEKNRKDDSMVIFADELDLLDEYTKESIGVSGVDLLHSLYGLDGVIKQIEEYISFVSYANADDSLSPSLHMKFIGNPGTGKTTVARILGKILKEKGYLRTGVFFEYSGNDFIAQYVGHTAPKVAQICRDAYGGVLFIDEAYALSPGKNDGNTSFRREALNTLITEMENHRKDMLVIMAGYEDEIDELMSHNPGLDQRIPYTIRFENYSKEALSNIFLSMAKKFDYSTELADTVKKYFETLPNNVYYSPTFSNARYVRNLYERTVSKAILRAQLEKKDVPTITPTDFEKAVEEIKNMSSASSVFGKDSTGARMFNEERAKIKFEDVCGQEEAKELLSEIVDCLKNPDKYKKIGAKIPKGALLYGPPGTGKTMLAKAVAGEAKVPVLTIAGSDLISSIVGGGSDIVKSLFEKARKMAPAIIFIDEIDSIGTSRAYGNSSSALLQLLVEMDGFDDEKTVIVLAATNQPEKLDPALTRPGRFDREVPVELPELEGRIAILKHYLKETQHEDNVDLHEVGIMTTGFSGADLKNVVNEAAHRALRQGRDKISTEDLCESVEVVVVGHVKKTQILSDKEKWFVCYHEIGHALVSALQTHTSPVKKITVVPRTGGTLGYVMHADEERKCLNTKKEMENRIAVCVAGRAAEEIQFGEITTGASNDIMQATRVARAIVASYGMTDEFGMVCFDISSGGYLGVGKSSSCSDGTAELIDKKVIEIVKEQYEKALSLLREHKSLLDELSEYIYNKESITGDEFMEIFDKKISG